MSTEKNVQIVKDFLAALGPRDKQDLLALSAEDIDRKSTRLNSSHVLRSRMPSSA